MRDVRRKLFITRRLYLATIVDDPDRRAAWELLCGTSDWDAARTMREQPDELDRASTDLTILREATIQVPLKTGFAPNFTDRTWDPEGDDLAQLEASIRRSDPRFAPRPKPDD
jgi:hypothetical protein